MAAGLTTWTALCFALGSAFIVPRDTSNMLVYAVAPVYSRDLVSNRLGWVLS